MSRRVTLAAALGALALLAAVPAHAGPREDMRGAYDRALKLFNDLELDAAMKAVDDGIAGAQSAGAGQDPVLASLYLLKAALIYSNEGDGAADRIVAEMENAVRLNYYVVIPVEVRSEGLVNYLKKAQARAGAAPLEPILHQTPDASCGGDLVFEALLGVPDGGLAALYWRRVGSTEFHSVEMRVFSNVAEHAIPATEHGDADIEYFIFAFDANSQAVANKGTQEDPLLMTRGCAATGGAAGEGEGEGEGDGRKKKRDKKPRAPSDTSLPRVWINIGVGTGVGVAHGEAEQTYEQYFPRNPAFLYGPAQSACAVARWYAGTGPLPAPAEAAQVFNQYAGAQGDQLAQAYQPGQCEKRHPVQAGMAPSLFHIAPEVQVRVAKRISLALFSRLQVVTGSNVERDDPTKQPGTPVLGSQYGSDESEMQRAAQAGTSYWDDVYTPIPSGFRQKPPFTWAIGLKFRYYLLPDDKKFRLFLGGFAGYGQSRLRVNMGFGNDRNGNSVPDDQEQAADALDPMGSDCYPVWPYLGACEAEAGNGDNLLAAQLSQNYTGKNRIDTVVIGPGFVGLLFGFNYQVVKNFAIYGELDIGGWFPQAGSVLFDLTVGPAISF